MDITLVIQMGAWGLAILSLLFLCTLLFSLNVHIPQNQNKRKKQLALKKVAVFVAARDEQDSLPQCLESLSNLDYPKDLLTFYVADDNSQDKTAALISKWVAGEKNRHGYFQREEPDPGVNGKARALALMTKEAKAELFLFTDADCRVPTTWVKSMVAAYEHQNGMVLGVTKVMGDGRFGRLQAMDWMLHLGVIKQLADWGYSLTAMGNNMLIGSKALAQVGGFGAVENSVTEDLAICRRLYSEGYRPFHLVGKDNLVETKAVSGWVELMQQRKRWAVGAMGLPLVWKFILFIQVAFFPAILGVTFFWPWIGLGTWTLKFVLQSIFLIKFASKTETIYRKIDLFIFEWYYLFTTSATAIYYFCPSKVKWKKRAY